MADGSASAKMGWRIACAASTICNPEVGAANETLVVSLSFFAMAHTNQLIGRHCGQLNIVPFDPSVIISIPSRRTKRPVHPAEPQ